MRVVTILSLVLLVSAIAVGQATVVGGTATNSAPVYGVYAAPFVPRIVTPSVSLTSVSPSPVGASNATFGNVAGARNATLSISTPAPVGVYTQPVLYNPTEPTAVLYIENVGAQSSPGMPARYAGFGVTSFQSNVGAAQLVASAGPARKASRTYTNQDVDRFNQNTGTVKYDGKTEQMK